MSQSKIMADKVYISARYLNINGLIQAGRDYTITLGMQPGTRSTLIEATLSNP
jgi:hypothetical protein